ncbi:uncharacterized protein LOC115439426 [Sphaeramia orbicularis]|uniref:uncharacterized protein LOC115439426 n=1 Tax=Sphaeramia orbicularis TaxID=375764 RepID=UPI00117CFB3F|nr:uncharacterized protein LOC115439426 [Sphaeramia orbicularis]
MVNGRRMPVIDRTVLEGQSIMLTCVLNCAVDLNSNPGYIWFKDRQQLTNTSEKSPSLFLDPIRNEDSGKYSCAMIGYENLPSSPVNLTVQTSPRKTWNIVSMDGNPGGGSKKGSEATLTHGCDVQSSTDQHLNNCQAHRGKSISTFSTMLLTCVSAGLVVSMMVTILTLRMKKRSNFRSAPHTPRHMNDPYVALDISQMSVEYDTLNSVRQCPTADTSYAIYENLPKHEYATG